MRTKFKLRGLQKPKVSKKVIKVYTPTRPAKKASMVKLPRFDAAVEMIRLISSRKDIAETQLSHPQNHTILNEAEQKSDQEIFKAWLKRPAARTTDLSRSKMIENWSTKD